MLFNIFFDAFTNEWLTFVPNNLEIKRRVFINRVGVMKVQIVFLAGVLFLGSCTSGEKQAVRVEKHVSKIVSDCSGVDADRMLSMEVSGMSCVMGCGASIRKELFATKAVCTVEFDFKEDRKFNTAKIAFDKDKITVDEIVQLVSKMDDNKFKVGKTSSEDYSCPTSKSDCSSDVSCPSECKKEVSKINASEANIELPNFLTLLSRFFKS